MTPSETVAAGEGDEEFGGEVGERCALGVSGVDEPAGGVFAVDVGGCAAVVEASDGGEGRRIESKRAGQRGAPVA